VDLVADPATTRGLFEAAQPESTAERSDGATVAIDSDSPNPAATSTEPPLNTAAGHHQEQSDEVSRLRQEIDGLKAKEAAAERRTKVEALLIEYHLPAPDATDPAAKAIVSETFLQSLLAAPDEPSMRRLVEDRARLVTSAKAWEGATKFPHRQPTSRDQSSFAPQPLLDAKSFASAITA
jgi:hypothetical protein